MVLGNERWGDVDRVPAGACGQRLEIAVKDLATPWCDKNRFIVLSIGPALILRVLADLKYVETRFDYAEKKSETEKQKEDS